MQISGSAALVLALFGLARFGWAQGDEEAMDAPELTKKARLTRTKWPYKRIRHNYALGGGAGLAAKPVVLKARVEKYSCYFVDMDGNGKFNDEGVDAWGLTGMNYVLPLEKRTIIELLRIWWRVDRDGKFVHYESVPVPLDRAAGTVFRQFNYWRLINGLPPVDIDPKLSDGCKQHCAWMEKNGMKHYPAEGDSPMTAQGEHAGSHSMLSEEKPGMSILMIYASFYHRLPVMHPGTRAIGIGHSRRYTAVDGMTNRTPREWNYPIIVPAPATALQPTHFPGEKPRPFPTQVKQAGFPITLTFDGGVITDARAKLRMRRGKRAIELPVFVSSPEYPAHKKRPDNRRSICVIPRAPLLPKTLYGVVVNYKLDGVEKEHKWAFTTGVRRPVWRR